jgi:hypothetical protein
MSAWRRRALSLFPALGRDLERPDYSVYQLFFDLKPMLLQAHEVGDDETLRRIYGFAEWCSEQSAKDLWNAAGVSFYEHVFDHTEARVVVPWLSPRVIANHWTLWEVMLDPDALR